MSINEQIEEDSSIIYPDNFEFSKTLPVIQQKHLFDSPIRSVKKFPTIQLSSVKQSTKKQEPNLNKIPKLLSTKLTSLLFTKKEVNLRSSQSYRKTKLMEFIHSQYLYNCLLQCFFSIITILSSVIEYEHTVISPENYPSVYIHTHKNNKSYIIEYDLNETYFDNCRKCALISSYVSLISSIFLWITIFFDFVLSYQISLNETNKDYKVFLAQKESLVEFILTFIIFIPCPNPMTFGIDVSFSSSSYDIDFFVPLNSILTAICFFRFWFVFKYYLVSSKTYTQRASRLCKMNNVDFNLSFPFKSHMAQDPLSIDTLLFLIFLFICSYNLRIFERYLDAYSNYDFGNFYNALWCIFITMTTVGYGDRTPSTEFGRIFTMIGCFAGVFLVSLIVVSVSNYFNIQGIEMIVLNVIDRAYIMDRKNEKGEEIVKSILVAKKKISSIKSSNSNEYLLTERNTINNNPEPNNKELNKYRKKIFDQLGKFKDAKVQLEKEYPSFNSFDEILAYLKFLEEDVEKNNQKVDDILELLNQINSYFADGSSVHIEA